MNILVTGSKGFIGTNLVKYLRENTNHTVFEFSRDDLLEDLENSINFIDIVFHLAGLNKKTKNETFENVNIKLTKKLCKILRKNSETKIIYASSIQINQNNEYGKSKKECENIILNLEKSNRNKVFILRLPGIFGMGCRPNYNSVVATFCNNVIKKKDLNIIDPFKEIDLVFIEDLCKQLANLVTDFKVENKYILIKHQYRVSIKELALIIKSFPKKPIPFVNVNNLDAKLYKTYLSYKNQEINL